MANHPSEEGTEVRTSNMIGSVVKVTVYSLNFDSLEIKVGKLLRKRFT
jgi:hypothetical protein